MNSALLAGNFFLLLAMIPLWMFQTLRANERQFKNAIAAVGRITARIEQDTVKLQQIVDDQMKREATLTALLAAGQQVDA